MVNKKAYYYTKKGWQKIDKCINNGFKICHSIGTGKHFIGTMERYICTVLCTALEY